MTTDDPRTATGPDPGPWPGNPPGKGVGSNDPSYRFQSGARSSEVKPNYRLVPLEALRRWAIRHQLGADHYGENNWRVAAESQDQDFLRDRLNHAVEHLMLYLNGDRSDDHLAAVICDVGMVITAEEMAKAKEAQEKVPIPKSGPDICRRCGHSIQFHGKDFGNQNHGCEAPIPSVTAISGSTVCGCPTFTGY